jgi:hypothetical protein
MSSAFVDMALRVGVPIVPVRFVGGLPEQEAPQRLEFPLGYGRQDYWIGRPILPEELARLPFKERKQQVVEAINALGPANERETPGAPDHAFGKAVDEWVARTGASAEDAVLFRTLEGLPERNEAVERLVRGAQEQELVLGGTPPDRWLARLARRLFGPRGPRVSEGD